MKTKTKISVGLAAFTVAVAAVLFSNSNSELFQGYLRDPFAEPVVSRVQIEPTVSRLSGPIEVTGFTPDRALQLQEIELKIAPSGFNVDSMRVYLNKTDITNALDEASFDFMTCPHCTSARGEDIETKIRFVEPIGVALDDEILVEMKVLSISASSRSLEAEIVSLTEVLESGELQQHRTGDLSYTIRPTEDARELPSEDSLSGDQVRR